MSMEHEASYRPVARSAGLVVEPIGDEVLVYDLESNEAHSLNPVTAIVWDAADGSRSAADLASLLVELGPAAATDAVHHILGELGDRGLLLDPPPAGSPRISRRQLMARIGAVGAGVMAFPLIDSLSAPLAAQQASCLADGEGCQGNAECCSGVCDGVCQAVVICLNPTVCDSLVFQCCPDFVCISGLCLPNN